MSFGGTKTTRRRGVSIPFEPIERDISEMEEAAKAFIYEQLELNLDEDLATYFQKILDPINESLDHSKENVAYLKENRLIPDQRIFIEKTSTQAEEESLEIINEWLEKIATIRSNIGKEPEEIRFTIGVTFEQTLGRIKTFLEQTKAQFNTNLNTKRQFASKTNERTAFFNKLEETVQLFTHTKEIFKSCRGKWKKWQKWIQNYIENKEQYLIPKEELLKAINALNSLQKSYQELDTYALGKAYTQYTGIDALNRLAIVENIDAFKLAINPFIEEIKTFIKNVGQENIEKIRENLTTPTVSEEEVVLNYEAQLNKFSICLLQKNLVRAGKILTQFYTEEGQKWVRQNKTRKKVFQEYYSQYIDFMAQSLRTLSIKKFTAIPREEFYVYGPDDETNSAPRLKESIQHFNQISNWVITSILDIKLPTTSEERETATKEIAARMEEFIELAHRCFELGDFSTTLAILSGFRQASIIRLYPSWSLISKSAYQHYETLLDWFSTQGNSRNIRAALKIAEDNSLAIIPFLGMFLTDLEFARTGNTKPSKRSKAEEPFINQIEIYQKNLDQEVLISEETVSAIQLDIVEKVESLNEETLYSKSLQIKPRGEGLAEVDRSSQPQTSLWMPLDFHEKIFTAKIPREITKNLDIAFINKIFELKQTIALFNSRGDSLKQTITEQLADIDLSQFNETYFNSLEKQINEPESLDALGETLRSLTEQWERFRSFSILNAQQSRLLNRVEELEKELNKIIQEKIKTPHNPEEIRKNRESLENEVEKIREIKRVQENIEKYRKIADGLRNLIKQGTEKQKRIKKERIKNHETIEKLYNLLFVISVERPTSPVFDSIAENIKIAHDIKKYSLAYDEARNVINLLKTSITTDPLFIYSDDQETLNEICSSRNRRKIFGLSEDSEENIEDIITAKQKEIDDILNEKILTSLENFHQNVVENQDQFLLTEEELKTANTLEEWIPLYQKLCTKPPSIEKLRQEMLSIHESCAKWLPWIKENHDERIALLDKLNRQVSDQRALIENKIRERFALPLDAFLEKVSKRVNAVGFNPLSPILLSNVETAQTQGATEYVKAIERFKQEITHSELQGILGDINRKKELLEHLARGQFLPFMSEENRKRYENTFWAREDIDFSLLIQLKSEKLIELIINKERVSQLTAEKIKSINSLLETAGQNWSKLQKELRKMLGIKLTKQEIFEITLDHRLLKENPEEHTRFIVKQLADFDNKLFTKKLNAMISSSVSDALQTRLNENQKALKKAERDQGSLEINLRKAQEDLNAIASQLSRSDIMEEQKEQLEEKQEKLKTQLERFSKQLNTISAQIKTLQAERNRLLKTHYQQQIDLINGQLFQLFQLIPLNRLSRQKQLRPIQEIFETLESLNKLLKKDTNLSESQNQAAFKKLVKKLTGVTPSTKNLPSILENIRPIIFEFDAFKVRQSVIFEVEPVLTAIESSATNVTLFSREEEKQYQEEIDDLETLEALREIKKQSSAWETQHRLNDFSSQVSRFDLITAQLTSEHSYIPDWELAGEYGQIQSQQFENEKVHYKNILDKIPSINTILKLLEEGDTPLHQAAQSLGQFQKLQHRLTTKLFSLTEDFLNSINYPISFTFEGIFQSAEFSEGLKKQKEAFEETLNRLTERVQGLESETDLNTLTELLSEIQSTIDVKSSHLENLLEFKKELQKSNITMGQTNHFENLVRAMDQVIEELNNQLENLTPLKSNLTESIAHLEKREALEISEEIKPEEAPPTKEELRFAEFQEIVKNAYIRHVQFLRVANPLIPKIDVNSELGRDLIYLLQTVSQFIARLEGLREVENIDQLKMFLEDSDNQENLIHTTAQLIQISSNTKAFKKLFTKLRALSDSEKQIRDEVLSKEMTESQLVWDFGDVHAGRWMQFFPGLALLFSNQKNTSDEQACGKIFKKITESIETRQTLLEEIPHETISISSEQRGSVHAVSRGRRKTETEIEVSVFAKQLSNETLAKLEVTASMVMRFIFPGAALYELDSLGRSISKEIQGWTPFSKLKKQSRWQDLFSNSALIQQLGEDAIANVILDNCDVHADNIGIDEQGGLRALDFDKTFGQRPWFAESWKITPHAIRHPLSESGHGYQPGQEISYFPKQDKRWTKEEAAFFKSLEHNAHFIHGRNMGLIRSFLMLSDPNWIQNLLNKYFENSGDDLKAKKKMNKFLTERGRNLDSILQSMPEIREFVLRDPDRLWDKLNTYCENWNEENPNFPMDMDTTQLRFKNFVYLCRAANKNSAEETIKIIDESATNILNEINTINPEQITSEKIIAWHGQLGKLGEQFQHTKSEISLIPEEEQKPHEEILREIQGKLDSALNQVIEKSSAIAQVRDTTDLEFTQNLENRLETLAELTTTFKQQVTDHNLKLANKTQKELARFVGKFSRDFEQLESKIMSEPLLAIRLKKIKQKAEELENQNLESGKTLLTLQDQRRTNKIKKATEGIPDEEIRLIKEIALLEKMLKNDFIHFMKEILPRGFLGKIRRQLNSHKLWSMFNQGKFENADALKKYLIAHYKIQLNPFQIEKLKAFMKRRTELSAKKTQLKVLKQARQNRLKEKTRKRPEGLKPPPSVTASQPHRLPPKRKEISGKGTSQRGSRGFGSYPQSQYEKPTTMINGFGKQIGLVGKFKLWVQKEMTKRREKKQQKAVLGSMFMMALAAANIIASLLLTLTASRQVRKKIQKAIKQEQKIRAGQNPSEREQETSSHHKMRPRGTTL
ncbi:MAG: hypothetical protein JW855_04280 [Gammaproteobacteria bacterium]|nr:hypothetical protein [Gammaproteobacteria bacterium]